MNIVLGSSSTYRKMLLEKLHLEFDICSPDIDESQLDHEIPADLVERLSIAKAQEVSKQFNNHLIIASDQVAVHDDRVLGKPGNFENALQQLTAFSGQSVQFITGLCLYNSHSNMFQYHREDTWVNFRTLSKEQITKYIQKDEPYQCAGSFRSEGLGCALFTSIKSNDPNALIGLPIIKLVELLFKQDIDVLKNLS